jgi:hypothetical protein
MTQLLFALPLFTVCATACHERVIAVSPAAPENPGLMTVTGTATLEVSPDCADLTMTLSSDNLRPGAATSNVDGKEQTLIAALKKDGVAPNDMKLSLITLEPVYAPNLYPLVIQTYRAQITVTVTTRDFAKVSQLMEAGADAGAISMSSQFRRSDMPELKKKVRDMALAAAKDKAKQTASALGVDIGKIMSVGENTGGYMWNQTYFPQNAVARDNSSGSTLGGTMQNLTLDVSIGYQLKG